jgi:hypothetical protein
MSSSLSEVEETLTRIQSHRGVVGVLILSSTGHAIRSSLDAAATEQYGALLSQLAAKAAAVARTLDPEDDLVSACNSARGKARGGGLGARSGCATLTEAAAQGGEPSPPPNLTLPPARPS